MQEKFTLGLTYIMQRKISLTDAGKTVTQHITNFSVLYASIFKCQILEYLYLHI
jgi:hypothetical protein